MKWGERNPSRPPLRVFGVLLILSAGLVAIGMTLPPTPLFMLGLSLGFAAIALAGLLILAVFVMPGESEYARDARREALDYWELQRRRRIVEEGLAEVGAGAENVSPLRDRRFPNGDAAA